MPRRRSWYLADIRGLDNRLKYIGGQIAALVTACGTTLMSLFGIGLVIARRVLAEVGDITRFTTKDKFASYNGGPTCCGLGLRCYGGARLGSLTYT